jgi:translocator protein
MQQFLVFAAIVFGAAAFGAMFPPDGWFSHLRKPSWNPPGWVFGPVWTTLYTFIALAGWLAYRRKEELHIALALWGAQLFFNAIWNYLFFGLHRPGLALIDMALLLVTVIACIVTFSQLSFTAMALMVPYALWVTFGLILNLSIYRLNRATV